MAFPRWLSIDGRFFLFYPFERWLSGPWDQFIEHGSVPILRKKHGITAEAAVEKVLAALPARKGIRVKPAA